jgi:hypothetical protein
MTLILKQTLSVLADGQSSALPVVMELHNDRFVLTEFANAPGQPAHVAIDTPLSDLKVGGSMAFLTFTAGDITRRVDFANGTGDALMNSVSLQGQSARILRDSGIYAWLKELRARNVSVKYRSITQVMLWGALATAGILVIIGVIVVNIM